jgi:hypothetical protein
VVVIQGAIVLQVRDGLLRCQAPTGPGFALAQEDVLLSWQRPPQPQAVEPQLEPLFVEGWLNPSRLTAPVEPPQPSPLPGAPALDGSALRLLPAWTSLRVAAVENSE